MDDPFFDSPFGDNPDPDEEFMEELHYYDLFVDDYALFVDGLLSEEDARQMYQCGEITREELIEYLNFKQNKAQQQSDDNTNPWVVALIIVIVILVFLFAVLGGF